MKLSKEQTQYLALGVIVVAAVLYASIRFGFGPMRQKGAERKAHLEELESNLDKAKRVITQEQRERDEINRVTREIRKVAALNVPPAENTLAWVTGELYEIARDVGVEIEWVEKVDKIFPLPAKMKTEPQNFRSPVFKPYVVRVLTVCSYGKCMELIGKMEDSNPYLCISEVQVVGQKNDVLNHRFTFVAEWPIWADYDQAMKTLNGGTKDKVTEETKGG